MRTRTIFILAGLLTLSACATDTDTYVRGTPRAPRRVLVAGTQSEFKKNVVDRVVQRLGEKDYFFTVSGLDGLTGQDLTAYGAIVLVYSLPGGRMDERVRGFIEKNRGNFKVIVFYSRGAEGPEPEDSADRRTLADLMANAGQYADKLAGLIEKRFP